MMSTSHDKRFSPARSRVREVRAAFTLVEVLVALAVMMLLLTIILVPVNMALDVFHIGKARNEVQLSNNTILNQLAAELRQAVFVYPNEAMPGITNKSPYTSANSFEPYKDSGTNSGISNTSRLDFLLPAKDAGGSTSVPTQASNYIVTYYARRLKPFMDDGTTDNPYDQYSNPIVLFRAQYAYKTDDGSATTSVNTDSTRYSPVDAWLTQNQWDEPNLESLSNYSATTQASNHQLITPRDMALVSPAYTTSPLVTNAQLQATDPTNTAASLKPDSSFICDDTNADGKIDRVTISLNLAKYDSGGAQSKSQQLRLSRVVNLPNVK